MNLGRSYSQICQMLTGVTSRKTTNRAVKGNTTQNNMVSVDHNVFVWWLIGGRASEFRNQIVNICPVTSDYVMDNFGVHGNIRIFQCLIVRGFCLISYNKSFWYFVGSPLDFLKWFCFKIQNLHRTSLCTLFMFVHYPNLHYTLSSQGYWSWEGDRGKSWTCLSKISWMCRSFKAGGVCQYLKLF